MLSLGPLRRPNNRNDPDFLFYLPILLNWYGRRTRYYPHGRLVESLVAPPSSCLLPPLITVGGNDETIVNYHARNHGCAVCLYGQCASTGELPPGAGKL